MTRRRVKVFIAGRQGFLGKKISERIISRRGIALLKKNRHFDFTVLRDCVAATRGADVVVNAAGLVTSRRDQARRPAEILYTNTLITLQLLEACRRNRISRFVGISSITAYPPGGLRLKEKTLFAGQAPLISAGGVGFYGLTRWLVPQAAVAYARAHGIRTRVAVFPNLYGPEDKFSHREPPLVPSLIKELHRAARRGDRVFSGGANRSQSVDLLYVDDAADFIVKMIAKFGNEGCIVANAGSGGAILIGEVADIIARETGFRGKILWEKERGPRPARRCLDNTIARTRYGWKPKTDFARGAKNTVAWYQTYYEKGK